VGFGVIAFIQLKHIWQREKKSNIPSGMIPYEDETAGFIFKQWQVLRVEVF